MYSISLPFSGLMKYLVPRRTNTTNFLSLLLDLVSILISSLCSEHNDTTLRCIQRGTLLLNVFFFFFAHEVLFGGVRSSNLRRCADVSGGGIVWSCQLSAAGVICAEVR